MTLGAEHGRAARERLSCVMRDLPSAEGAFSCAEDAGSEGDEGRVCLATADPIRETLGRHGPAAMAEVTVQPEGSDCDARTGAKIVHRCAAPAAA